MKLKNTTVQRITFGKVVTPPLTDCGGQGYLLGLGKRPKGLEGTHVPSQLSVVGESKGMKIDRVYSQLSKAEQVLKSHALPLEEGPYADKEGVVEDLVKDLSDGVKTRMEFIERMIEVLRPFKDTESEMELPRFHDSDNYFFAYNHDFADIPDVLTTAGEILTQENRQLYSDSFGRELTVVCHPLEHYLLAVSALRRKKINAYPALAVMPHEGGEGFFPLIAIVKLSEKIPLQTFALTRFHPSMSAVDIISDVAMKGATYAMLAETRAKHLIVEIVEQSKLGKTLSEDEVENQLERIGDMLFECHKAWPGSHIAGDALVLMVHNMAEAMMVIQIAEFQNNMAKIAEEQSYMVEPGAMEHHIQVNAMEIAKNYTDRIRNHLFAKIAGIAPQTENGSS
jgi:hypothetical protein